MQTTVNHFRRYLALSIAADAGPLSPDDRRLLWVSRRTLMQADVALIDASVLHIAHRRGLGTLADWEAAGVLTTHGRTLARARLVNQLYEQMSGDVCNWRSDVSRKHALAWCEVTMRGDLTPPATNDAASDAERSLLHCLITLAVDMLLEIPPQPATTAATPTADLADEYVDAVCRSLLAEVDI